MSTHSSSSGSQSTRRGFLAGLAAAGGASAIAGPAAARQIEAGQVEARQAAVRPPLTEEEIDAIIAAGDEKRKRRSPLTAYFEVQAKVLEALYSLHEATDELSEMDVGAYDRLCKVDRHSPSLADMQNDLHGTAWTTNVLEDMIDGGCADEVFEILEAKGWNREGKRIDTGSAA